MLEIRVNKFYIPKNLYMSKYNTRTLKHGSYKKRHIGAQ